MIASAICCSIKRALFFGILTVGLIHSNALAKTNNWQFNFEFKSGYNDNILSYSDVDLDNFDTTTTDTIHKFGIKSKDDFILSPSAEIVYSGKLFRHSFSSGLKYSYSFYAKNGVKRYGSVGLWAKEFFKKETFLELKLAYVPNYYYRNLFVTTYNYAAAKFNKFTSEIRFGAPLHKLAKGSIYYLYENKDFNFLFNERDIKAHYFGAEVTIQPVALWKAVGGYEFCTARAAGRNHPIDRRDTSFDSFLFWLGPHFYLKGYKHKELQAAASFSYKAVLFQTNKLSEEDRYRFGRKDDRWIINLSLKQNMAKNFDIGLEYNHTINNPNVPAIDPKKFLEYKANSINIIFDYSF